MPAPQLLTCTSFSCTSCTTSHTTRPAATSGAGRWVRSAVCPTCARVSWPSEKRQQRDLLGGSESSVSTHSNLQACWVCKCDAAQGGARACRPTARPIVLGLPQAAAGPIQAHCTACSTQSGVSLVGTCPPQPVQGGHYGPQRVSAAKQVQDRVVVADGVAISGGLDAPLGGNHIPVTCRGKPLRSVVQEAQSRAVVQGGKNEDHHATLLCPPSSQPIQQPWSYHSYTHQPNHPLAHPIAPESRSRQ